MQARDIIRSETKYPPITAALEQAFPKDFPKYSATPKSKNQLTRNKPVKKLLILIFPFSQSADQYRWNTYIYNMYIKD